MNKRKIIIREAREHNLKNISIEIPHHELVVITGVSGSGKSTLAYDLIYQEARRRYLESFSVHARQFLGRMHRPEVNSISGLSPAITINQKTVIQSSRSTVGTLSGIYDYLRLLMARLGECTSPSKTVKPSRSLFSFNSIQGACPHCAGMGVEDRIDPERLISDPQKTLRQGALSITTPSGYIIYSQVTMEVLQQVCQSEGFSVDIPWQELSPEQQHIVLYGSDKIKIPYGKHTLESRMRWSGITAKPREEGYYKGILPVMEAILKRDRNKNILRFARSIPCSQCNGSRLKPEALAITLDGKNIAQLAALSIQQLKEWLQNYQPKNAAQAKVATPITTEIIHKLELLSQLGLAYLQLNRPTASLSGGESQRIRLASQTTGGLQNLLFVLDEPSAGMHPADNQHLIRLLKHLRDNGNSLLVIEHDEATMCAADRLIDIGPAAGNQGGEVLINASLEEALKSKTNSRTIELLKHPNQTNSLNESPPPKAWIHLEGIRFRNLKNLSVQFALGQLNVVTGVSGAGKKSLVKGVLAPALQDKTDAHNRFQTLNCPISIRQVIEIDQSSIGKTPRSNPATYTKLFDSIRNLYARQPLAQQRQYSKGRFSFNTKGGRCESCEGAGVKQIGMHFMGAVEVLCEHCNGRRFNPETLEVKFNGKNIAEVLELSVDEALSFFCNEPAITHYLDVLSELGLGYIKLGQSSSTLSGGEAQRVKLSAELSKKLKGHTLYILDEPSTGLHGWDVNILLKSLTNLTQKGHTVVVVEHHASIIRAANHVIDLGPDSGEHGGLLIYQGPPAGLQKTAHSRTGHFLNPRPLQTSSAKKRTAVADSPPIRLEKVCTHNLQSVNVEIPANQLTVITGVSGSGKSSLAFNTLFAEGQKRYMQSFSTYARTRLKHQAQAEFESATGLTPPIAISQGSASRNPRSTVGTMTELYDLYRLLFARIGKNGHQDNTEVLSSLFSFNHEQGACPACKGLGTSTVCDPGKLITHPESSLLEGAMNGSKTGKFYGDPSGQYTAMLSVVGQTHQVDYAIPWNRLSARAKHIALNGSGDKTYDVNWHFKRKNREGTHHFTGKWQGFIGLVNEEYQRKHADNRGESMLPIMKAIECSSCHGTRLRAAALNYTLANKNIAQLGDMAVSDAINFFKQLQRPHHLSTSDNAIASDLIKEICFRLEALVDLGLGHLQINRRAAGLSGGEAQRVRLAGQLGAQLTGLTYVLDEPTVGLHSRDTQKLLNMLHRLCRQGNTVVVVEHDAELIRAADHVIDMGPGAGQHGGQIIASGSPASIQNNDLSITGKYLSGQYQIKRTRNLLPPSTAFSLQGAFANNLKHFDLHIPTNRITVITGVSGSGKSSLMHQVIRPSLQHHQPQGCKSFVLNTPFENILSIDQSPVDTNPYSSVATYTGLMNTLRKLFATTDYARGHKMKVGHFSYNTREGQCPECKGLGYTRVSMDFLADVKIPCEACHQKRFNPGSLANLFQGKNIGEVLQLTVDEAIHFFATHSKIIHDLMQLQKTGLGYLQMGQSTDTLSGGEAQRLRLAREILRTSRGQNLYLFDEPTTGLHFHDISILIKLFDELIAAGHTLLLIEHQADVIRQADVLIELGPHCGSAGGELLFYGSPEDLLKQTNSPTAEILRSRAVQDETKNH